MTGSFCLLKLVFFRGYVSLFLGGLLVERFSLFKCFLPMALFHPASVFAIAAYRQAFPNSHDSNWGGS